MPSVPLSRLSPSFGSRLDRFEPLGLEHAGGGNSLAIDQEETLADERESKVSEGSEVAGGPDRTPIRNGREQVAAEELDEALDDGRADARVALSQCSGAEQQHRSDGRSLEEIANPRGVAADEVVLQFGGLLGRDARIRECTEAGRDPVCHLVVGDDRLNQGPGGRHSRQQDPGLSRRWPFGGQRQRHRRR